MALVFLAVLRATHPEAGTFVVGDVLQEAAFFDVVLVVLKLLGWAVGRAASATAGAPLPRSTSPASDFGLARAS